MKTTSISELKICLRSYLSEVNAGEEFIVTQWGKPVAKIVPIKRKERALTPHLLTLERAGLARIGKSSLPPDFWSLPRPKVKKGVALKALLDEREGR